MSEMSEHSYKKATLKLKNQEKELQMVKSLINRSNGYAKTQAEASETRLTEEIALLKKELDSIPVPVAKKKAVKAVRPAKKKVAKAAKPAKPAKKVTAKKKKTK